MRKRQARESHKASYDAQNLRGLRAKLYQQKRHKEKIQMKKRIKEQEEKNVKSAAPDEPSKTPLPQYLLDRSQATNAKALSSAIKDKRAEKAAKFAVPLPKVKGISEEEMFKVVNTGKKTHKKSWKRMITKPTFVGNDFTRRPVKYERFIRPMGLRYKKANVTQYVSPNSVTLYRGVSLLDEGDLWWKEFANSETLQPRTRCYCSTPYPLCQKEPSEPALHSAGCPDQGYHRRSQRLRAWSRHDQW
jgi:ribosomal protein S8E